MNKDILLLGNPSKLGCVVKDENNKHVKSFIDEHSDNILEYIKSCFTTHESIGNKRLEQKLYDFVEEYIHFYNNSVKTDENCTSTEPSLSPDESAILHEAFMNLKQNRQKSVMESFENHKTVSLVSCSKQNGQSNSKIMIQKQIVENHIIETKNEKQETNNFKSIDLSDEI